MAKHAFRYTRDKGVHYPPSSEFSKFIQDVSLERNDPNLAIDHTCKDSPPPPLRPRSKQHRQTYKTELKSPTSEQDRDLSNWCILHERSHPLSKCRAFRAKSIDERKNLVRQHRLCFRCLASRSHMAKDCKSPVKCSECQSDRHLDALHVTKPVKPKDPEKECKAQGGEQGNKPQDGVQKDTQTQGGENEQITTTCTEICGKVPGGRSCSKIS
mgnify:CR=1 FL=1